MRRASFGGSAKEVLKELETGGSTPRCNAGKSEEADISSDDVTRRRLAAGGRVGSIAKLVSPRISQLATPRTTLPAGDGGALAIAESAAAEWEGKYHALARTMRENASEWEAKYKALAEAVRGRNERFLPHAATQTVAVGSALEDALDAAKAKAAEWRAKCEEATCELTKLRAALAEADASAAQHELARAEAEAQRDAADASRRKAQRVQREAEEELEELRRLEAEARHRFEAVQLDARREIALAAHVLELSRVEVADARREATKAAAAAAKVAARARDDAQSIRDWKRAAKFEAERGASEATFQRMVRQAEHARAVSRAMRRAEATQTVGILESYVVAETSRIARVGVANDVEAEPMVSLPRHRIADLMQVMGSESGHDDGDGGRGEGDASVADQEMSPWRSSPAWVSVERWSGSVATSSTSHPRRDRDLGPGPGPLLRGADRREQDDALVEAHSPASTRVEGRQERSMQGGSPRVEGSAVRQSNKVYSSDVDSIIASLD